MTTIASALKLVKIMSKVSVNVVVVIVMLFAFVGQTVAFSFSSPCEGETENQTLTEQVAKNDTSTASDDDCCDIECCILDCLCIANACSPLVYLSNATTSIGLNFNVISGYYHESRQPISIPIPLYRPPIFTS